MNKIIQLKTKNTIEMQYIIYMNEVIECQKWIIEYEKCIKRSNNFTQLAQLETDWRVCYESSEVELKMSREERNSRPERKVEQDRIE